MKRVCISSKRVTILWAVKLDKSLIGEVLSTRRLLKILKNVWQSGKPICDKSLIISVNIKNVCPFETFLVQYSIL